MRNEQKKQNIKKPATKMIEAEEVVEALRNCEVDAIVGMDKVYLLRLAETEQQLKKDHEYLEQLVIERGKLLEDLKVHQVELHTQAEELRRSQQEAQESRDKYLNLYDHAPVGYFTLDEHNRIVEANLTGCQLLKVARNSLLKQSFTKFINPEESDSFYLQRRKVLESGSPQTGELQMRKADGTLFYAQVNSSKVIEERLRLAVMDVTERKKAEDALAKAMNELETRVQERTRELSQANKQLKQYGYRITQVQEAERKRIAFELHDDTAQYLSILKMQLGALVNSEKILDPEIKQKLQFLEKDAERAFNDVRRYSHELRPSVLEHLGLLGALQQIAEDFTNLGQLSVDVIKKGTEPELSEEVKLGFFRIAQEALNNTRKHAKANRVVIDIRFNRKQVWMMVSDDGMGFNQKEALTRSGDKGSLGLMSMRERANLINADLKIESEPGKGTQVTLKAKI